MIAAGMVLKCEVFDEQFLKEMPDSEAEVLGQR